MNDRVHACLDGEFPREALRPEEQARLAALESTLEDAASAMRAVPAPDLVARVMRNLPQPEPATPPAPALWERALAWLWQPRTLTIQLRPAYAFAGLSVAVLAAVLAPRVGPAADPAAAVARVAADAPRSGARLYVQFRLEAPGASQVELAGSFTEWRPAYELREVAPGVWSALVPLEPGVHDYTFVVDGQEWVVDPYAPQVEDSFGGSNSRLFLPAPRGV